MDVMVENRAEGLYGYMKIVRYALLKKHMPFTINLYIPTYDIQLLVSIEQTDRNITFPSVMNSMA